MSTSNKNKSLIFEDFNPKKAFNGILAIEPELGTDYFYSHKKGAKIQNEASRTSTLKKEFKGLIGHNESSMIWEVSNMHSIDGDLKDKLVKKFTKDYKNCFTLGGSKKPSGGVHFHVMSQLPTDVVLPIFNNISMRTMNDNLLYTLLYGFINDNKFYARSYGSYSDFGRSDLMPHEDRSYTACTKREFLPAIEYRANNVFDIRLYGYYVGLSLLGVMGIKLASPYANNDIISTFERGITKEFPKSQCDEWGRMHVTKYEPSFVMKPNKDFSMVTYKRNLGKILFVLSVNTLVEARKALEEYILENLGLKIAPIVFDASSNKATKAREGYTIEMNGVVYFFKDKSSIRKKLRNLKTPLVSTNVLGRLSLIGKTIKKINLIEQ